MPGALDSFFRIEKKNNSKKNNVIWNVQCTPPSRRL